MLSQHSEFPFSIQLCTVNLCMRLQPATPHPAHERVLPHKPVSLSCSSSFITTLLNNAGLRTSPRPREISGFCSLSRQHLSLIESPNDLGLTQLTPWIRKGLGKSHQYYLRGRTLRTKKRRGGENQEPVWVILRGLDGVEKGAE